MHENTSKTTNSKSSNSPIVTKLKITCETEDRLSNRENPQQAERALQRAWTETQPFNQPDRKRLVAKD